MPSFSESLKPLPPSLPPSLPLSVSPLLCRPCGRGDDGDGGGATPVPAFWFVEQFLKKS